MYKTKKNPELLESFYNNFVRKLRIKFEEGFDFINTCLEEYYRINSVNKVQSFEEMNQFNELKNLKEKLNELENIKLDRLNFEIDQMKKNTLYEKNKNQIFEKYSLKLQSLKNIIKIFPNYNKIKLNFLFQNKLMNKMPFLKNFYKKGIFSIYIFIFQVPQIKLMIKILNLLLVY